MSNTTTPALLGGDPVRTRPFPSWPVFDGVDETLLLNVFRSGNWWCYAMGEATGAPVDGAGSSKVAEFQHRFAEAHGASFGIACSTGMAALEVALKALGVKAGDEVVVPPYTFIATATAPMNIEAIPVFCDVDSETFNLDPASFERAIGPRTRAVIPVHFAGAPADMQAICSIARRRGIAVLEDAAHAHGARWNDQPCGSIGDAAAFSFQVTKNMTSGEGGIITTNDERLAELCESYVWVGRKIGRPWYEHHRLGWNYRLTEFQAALLLGQLTRLETQTVNRQACAHYLSEQLHRIPGISPLLVPSYCTRSSFHLFVLRFDARAFGLDRDRFVEALQAEGIPCSTGYAFPLYRNPLFWDAGLSHDYRQYAASCPNAEQACREAVWLEHRLLLGTIDDMKDIVRAIEKVHHAHQELEERAAAT